MSKNMRLFQIERLSISSWLLFDIVSARGVSHFFFFLAT